MNVEVEFFKQEEKKLVVLRKLQGEGRVTDFEPSIIYEDEYDAVFKDSSKVNRQIEKNYKEYLGGRSHVKVKLDSLVYIGNFSLTFSQWEEFSKVWKLFESSRDVYERYTLEKPKSRRELRNGFHF